MKKVEVEVKSMLKRKKKSEIPIIKKMRKRKEPSLQNDFIEELNCDETPITNKLSAKKFKATKPSKVKQNEEKKEINCENSTADEVTEPSNNPAWSSLGVPSKILKALEDQNFTLPTPIQALTLAPAILGRRDILGAAETGSGKTLAFGIPILAGILEHKQNDTQTSDDEFSSIKEVEDCGATNGSWFVSNKKNGDNDSNYSDSEADDETYHLNEDGLGCVKVIDNIHIDGFDEVPQAPRKPLYALILTPTRELAIQIRNHMCNAAKYTDINIAVIVGGMAAVKQERILNKGPEIVIATPGRLWELIDQGNPHLSQIDSIKYLAIDETDRMLEKGHFQELHQIFERMNTDEESLKNRQTFVFSATLTLVHDIPDYLQRKKNKNSKSKIFKLTPGLKLQKFIDLLKIKNPKVVDVTMERGTAGTLTECRIACTIDHKDYYLYYFLKRHFGRTLVFCNSIGCVRRLATLFGILDCNPLPLHASMPQKQRLKNLERFQQKPNGLLIATDVAARGLDIPNVEHVIHYQVPRTSESYVHRSGRTARAQKEGITVLMMEPSEMQYYTKLCKTLGHTQDIPTFPVIDRLLIAVKECVNLAREIDKLELKCRRDNVQKGWLKKAVEEMDLVLDEDQIETTMECKESADLKRQLKIKRKQLSSLLSKPLFPKGFSGKFLDTNINLEQLQPHNKTAVEIMKKVIDDNTNKKCKNKIGGVTKKNRSIIKKKNFKRSRK
ncbi:hypothetical protein PV327_003517 [Microctonus hyperodae]|uniref:ATP-dependent RNA helicase n=1 Tax=Microctonus hyperodae TaxID=165561 RepID=A0AA39G454_MICHY|nr:hypothetical protein PV327_003517 [Microctonus hyperodae]